MVDVNTFSGDNNPNRRLEWDRIMVFDPKDELSVIREAARTRIDFRKQTALQPFHHDIWVTTGLHDGRCYANNSISQFFAGLLIDYADRLDTLSPDQGNVSEIIDKRSRVVQLGREIVWATQAFEGVRADDPDQFWHNWLRDQDPS